MQDGRSSGVEGNAEGSVMFSLRELRGLEVSRIEDEIVADRRQAARRQEAELAAVAAEQAARAAAERAELERQQTLAEERERIRRQNELELIAIEARLDQEEQEHLELVRRAAEAEAAIAIKRASPFRKLAGPIGAALLIGGLTVAYLMRAGDVEMARAQAQAQAQALAARQVVEQAKQAEVARFATQLAGLQSQLTAVEQRELAKKAALEAHQAALRQRKLEAAMATAGATRPKAKSAASSVLDPSVDGVLDNL